MSEKQKIIGFRQKVPVDILTNALFLFLRDGNLEREEIVRDLSGYFTGKNRISKAATTVNLVINNNEAILSEIRKKIDADSFMRLPDSEKQAFLTCLICLAYPFAYDALVSAAKVLKSKIE